MPPKKTEPKGLDNPGPRGFEKVVPSSGIGPGVRSSEHVRWEYMRVALGGDEIGRLNEYGQDRWEAVSIDQYNGIAWMKRQTA